MFIYCISVKPFEIYLYTAGIEHRPKLTLCGPAKVIIHIP